MEQSALSNHAVGYDKYVEIVIGLGIMEVIHNFDKNNFTGIIWDKSSEGELAISKVAHVVLLWRLRKCKRDIRLGKVND